VPELRASVSDPIRVQPLHHELEDTGRMLARCSEEKALGNLSYHKEQNPDSNPKGEERLDPEAKTTEKKLKGTVQCLSGVGELLQKNHRGRE